MSKEQYSPIRFQLNENIWLDHHSHAAEIVSLELEPDIEVIEQGNYLTISGSLVLTGRFEASLEEGEEALDLESSSLAEQLKFQPLRIEQKEIYEDSYRGKIERRFPLDVTVPINKIDDIEDVYVQVEQFDYSVFDGHRLNLQADVCILGIRTEPKIVENVEREAQASLFQNPLPSFDVAASKDEIPDTKQNVNFNEQVREQEAESELETEEAQFQVSASREGQSFASEEVRAEATVEKEESNEATRIENVVDDEENRAELAEENRVEDRDEVRVEDRDETRVEDRVEAKAENVADNEENRVKDRVEAVGAARAEAQVKKRAAAEVEENIENEAENVANAEVELLEERESKQPIIQFGTRRSQVREQSSAEQEDDKVVPLFNNEIRTIFNSLSSVERVEEVENSAEEEEEKERTESKTASFLTQLMSGENNVEEQYTRLKMCIIQKDESLELIAERYEVPVREIMRVNHLDNEQVGEGQILYIPKA